MAFKRTHARDCQREGLARDLDAFVEMLADIVLNSTFPAEELERERQVILQELTRLSQLTADNPAKSLIHIVPGS